MIDHLQRTFPVQWRYYNWTRISEAADATKVSTNKNDGHIKVERLNGVSLTVNQRVYEFYPHNNLYVNQLYGRKSIGKKRVVRIPISAATDSLLLLELRKPHLQIDCQPYKATHAALDTLAINLNEPVINRRWVDFILPNRLKINL